MTKSDLFHGEAMNQSFTLLLNVFFYIREERFLFHGDIMALKSNESRINRMNESINHSHFFYLTNASSLRKLN